MYNFNISKTTKDEFVIITDITKRAVDLDLVRKNADGKPDSIGFNMDLEAVHNTIGLKLKELLNADDGNFAHDILGIRYNIDRNTGKLNNCFLLRYSK